MAEMIEPEILQLLIEQIKTSELRINKAFDRMLGILREKPEDSANKEIKPPDSDWTTDRVRSQEADIEAIENLPEEKPTKGANEDYRVISNSKIESPPKPNTNPNPNLPTQTHSSLAVNKNTSAYVYSKVPRPWPGNTHIHTRYKTHTTEILSQILQQTQRGKTHRFHLLNVLNFDGQLRTSPVASQAWIRAQPMPSTSDLFLLLYDFQNLKVGMSSSSPSRASVANKANTVSLQSADHFSVAFKQLYTFHCNSWTAAARPTSFPGVDRLRSRPDRPLLDSPVAIQALNRFQNRVFAVAQIRVTVIAILRHLPEFDPGDHRLKGGEGRLDFDFDGVFAIFDQFWDHERQEEGDYGFMKMIDEIWGSIFTSKRKKLGFIVCDFWALGFKEKNCGFFWEISDKLRRSGSVGFKGWLTPNPILKHSVLCSYIGLAGAFWRAGSIRLGPIGLLVQLVPYQSLAKWAALHLANSSAFGKLGHLQTWANWATCN